MPRAAEGRMASPQRRMARCTMPHSRAAILPALIRIWVKPKRSCHPRRNKVRGVCGRIQRVKFYIRDASDPELQARYDLVTAFECIHDMSNPVGVLRAMRALAGPHGAVLIMDERVGDAFTGAGDEVERMMYG